MYVHTYVCVRAHKHKIRENEITDLRESGGHGRSWKGENVGWECNAVLM